MTGFITVDTQGRQVIDSAGEMGRSSGLSAQSWSGAALSGGGALANAHLAQAHGSHHAADARPGYLSAGNPGGYSANTRVPGGTYTANDQVQLVNPNAGQAGGGADYPNVAAGGVAHPGKTPNWNTQASTGDEFSQLVITSASLVNETHGVAFSVNLAATGGNGSFTWSTSTALPTGVTLSAAGALAGTTGTSAGTTAILVQVADSHNNKAQKIISLVLS